MTEPELLQLIERVRNDLDNNWAVDADDIRVLLEMTKIQFNEEWDIKATRKFGEYKIEADWMCYTVEDKDNVLRGCDATEDGVFHNMIKAEQWIEREKKGLNDDL